MTQAVATAAPDFRAGAMEAAFECSPIAIAVLDAQGRWLDANPAACALLGRARFALAGRCFLQTVSAHSRGEAAAELQRLLDGSHERGSHELWIDTRDGSAHVRADASVLRDASGGVCSAILYLQDITQRKRTEELAALLSSALDRQLAQLAASVPGALLSFRRHTDGREEVLYASAAAQELFGVAVPRTPADFEALRALHHPEDLARLAAAKQAPERFPASRNYSAEFRHRHPQRGEIWLETHTRADWDAQGVLTVHAFTHEVSERKRAEQRLALVNFALERVREAAFILGEDGRVCHVNEEACRQLGRDREALLALHAWDINAEYTPQRWADEWAERTSDQARTLLTWHRRSDGRLLPVEAQCARFRYAGRDYVLALVRDIGKRLRRERREQARLQLYERLAGGGSLDDVLGLVARYVEQSAEDAAGVHILLLEPDGRWRVAAASGKTARESAVAWSESIPGAGTATLGAVTLYRREAGRPGEPDLELLRSACALAAIAIERTRLEAERASGERRLQQSRDQLRELAARSERAREEERRRIAHEIHDELGQLLTALRMGISTLDLRLGEQGAAVSEHLNGLLGLTDRTLHVVRNIVSTLRPAALDLGLVSALEWLAAEFRRHSGLACRLHALDEPLEMCDERATAVFRIVQESLTNVARHARAACVDVRVQRDGAHYRIEVRDDGVGFDPALTPPHSFGLIGMRERAWMVSGELSLSSAAGGGTLVRLRVPA